jgi:isopenicillin N synthase-like dioxygenase
MLNVAGAGVFRPDMENGLSTPTDALPIIDMATYRAGDPKARARLIADIADNSRRLGFFYLINHGVPDTLLTAQLDWSRRFFDLPDAEKAALDFRNLPVRRGYEPIAQQTLQAGMQPDQKESFSIGRDPAASDAPSPFEGPNQWPPARPGFDAPAFRRQMETYRQAMTDLGRELSRLFAASLDLPEDFFAEALAQPSVVARMLHYPPRAADAPPDRLGCGAHTDWGLITILLQDDCGGLEIETDGGSWLHASPVPGALIINLGDMVVRLTAGRYASNLHRVLNTSPDRDRYSVATFFNPHAHYVVDCVPTCRAPGRKPESITFADHIQAMVEKTYAV